MSVAKVNMFSDLDALALYPFKRLFAQRKHDHYQVATREYTDKLRQFYRAHAAAKLHRANRRKQSLESDVLRLDASLGQKRRLHGMTIAKSSLPGAEQGDQIVLVAEVNTTQATETESAPDGSSSDRALARGLIQAITESEIKIKLSSPLVLRPEDEEASTISLRSSESTGVAAVAAEPAPEQQQHQPNGDTSKQEETSEHQQEAQQADGDKQTKYIDFKIKYDPKASPTTTTATTRRNNVDENTSAVMDLLSRFDELKCDPILHKILLGFYDERHDLVHEKARVMTFEGLLQPRGQQRLAIEHALKRRLSLVEGPAGSGKTLVAAHIAANMSRVRRAKILICSPLQNNVDKLVDLIAQVDGLQVVKLPGGPVKLSWDELLEQSKPVAWPLVARQASDPNTPPVGGLEIDVRKLASTDSEKLHLDKLVDDEIYRHAWARSKETLRNNRAALQSHAYRMVTSCSPHKRREIEARLLGRADVICGTNKQASSRLLNSLKFDMLILDDVQLTSELDCLVPMMARGLKQVVLLSESRKQIRLARTLKRSQSSVASTTVAAPSSSPPPPPPPPQPTTAAASGNHIAETELVNSSGTSSRQQNGTVRSGTSSLRRKGSKRNANSNNNNNKTATQANGSTKPAESPARSGSISKLLGLTSEPSQEAGGLFERLLGIGLPSIDLRTQFRMHETLSNFTNHHFYLGRLKDDLETNDKMTKEIQSKLVDEARFDWLPNPKYLTAMFNVSCDLNEATTSSPASFDAKLERCLKALFDRLEHIFGKLTLDVCTRGYRVKIICNVHFDWSAWSVGWLQDTHPGTVVDFAGQEEDFVILLAMPSTATAVIAANAGEVPNQLLSNCTQVPCDFKTDDSALNCALTRARLGLMIITAGDDPDDHEQAEPSQQPTACRGWLDLVQYYKASGLYVSVHETQPRLTTK